MGGEERKLRNEGRERKSKGRVSTLSFDKVTV